MRALILRAAAVTWIAGLSFVSYIVTDRGLDGIGTMVLVFLVPVWAAQFILTGIVNPVRLFAKAFSRTE